MSEVKKVPEIRFAGFAEPWEQRKLGELSSSFEYGLNAAAKEYDGKNKYIRITDIDDDNREFKQENITSPDTDLSFAENYRLSEGDILFARTGASVGKSYIYKASDGLVYYAGFLIRARIKPEYNSEFVFQNTLTGDYEKFIKVTSMRSGQPGVNAQEYSQYQIMVPGKPEQDMISAYLQSLDNLITLHQRKHDKLVVLKKAMLEKMFPQNGSNVPEIRFAGFTGPWEQRKLGDLVQFSKGVGYSKADLTEDGTPIILYGRLYTKYETAISDVDTFAIAKSGSVYSRGGEVIVPASGETAEDISIASVVEKSVYHIHGQFDKTAAVYDPDSFRNQLSDAPVRQIDIDQRYFYLYSNALSTHCGKYKEFQLKQFSLANAAVEKFVTAYIENPKIKQTIDHWTKSDNTITANMGYAVQLKAKHPELEFVDNYHFDKLSEITGKLDVLGLSPWNDFHIFRLTINEDGKNLRHKPAPCHQ